MKQKETGPALSRLFFGVMLVVSFSRLGNAFRRGFPVNDVFPFQVFKGEAENMDEPRERPDGKKQKRRKDMKLKAEGGTGHQLRARPEDEESAKPRPECFPVIKRSPGRRIADGICKARQYDNSQENEGEQICFSSVSGYSFICHPADEQETSADDGGHSGHPSEPDGAKMVQIIGNSEEIKKAFRNQNSGHMSEKYKDDSPMEKEAAPF